MKKRIISLLLIGVCGLGLIGCKATVEVPYQKSNNDDIINTKDKYMINGIEYDVYCDIHTNIIYLHKNNQTGYSKTGNNIIPLIGSDKQPMTLDEYNATK